MKITVDKYEYAKIIRSCAKNSDGYTPCQNCALQDVCGGKDALENSVEIVESAKTKGERRKSEQ